MYRRQIAQIQEYSSQLELIHLFRYEGQIEQLPMGGSR
jgi:hypothetical protein